MAYKVLQATALFKAPSVDADILAALLDGELLTFAGEKKDTTWVKVRHPSSAEPGWVQAKDVKEIADAPRPPVKLEDFVPSCILAERAMNAQPSTAPWFVAADFVIARAIIETGIVNSDSKIGDGIGPLQVTSAEWDAFLKSPLGIEGEFQPEGRNESTVQTTGAAFRMFSDAKAISAAKLAKGVGSASDPFVPSYLDVFHAYLTNSPQAAVAILDASSSDADKNKKLNEVLTGPLTAEQVAAFFNARTQFAGTAAQPKSVSEFVAATKAALDAALKKAFDLEVQFAPEELPRLKQGEAPWFDVAKEEEKKNIAEPDQRILTYFGATDLSPKPTSTTTPWCGAFAAFCMKTSGATAVSVPKGAARAANWKTWGNEISLQSGDIPAGAVVVLSPDDNTGGSGHVGFFVQFLDGGRNVQLLGGNQSNKVIRTSFATAKIAAVRWLDLAPATAAEAPGGPPSNTPISADATNLIVKFEIGSKEDYLSRYHLPEWPQGASGVTIGIGYDVGYTTAAQLQADWRNKISAAMIGALGRALGVTGPPAGPLARELRASVDVPFDKAMEVFTQRDIPKWVGIVQRALPNTDKLSRDCLGALVSLAYNRGASFSKDGDRYTEMRAIKDCMARLDLAGIPEQFRSMKRLWPDLRGLRDRRDAEAALFERGRTKPAGT